MSKEKASSASTAILLHMPMDDQRMKSSQGFPLLFLIIPCFLQFGLLFAEDASKRQQVGRDNGKMQQNLTEPSAAAGDGNGAHFLVLTQVTNLRWTVGCISSQQLCSEPRLILTNQMHKSQERVAKDWPLPKAMQLISQNSLQLFTFWTRGQPSDVGIQISVQGIDPRFRFARVCDESPPTFVFQTSSHFRSDSTEEEQATTKVQLELHAPCFNATLTVELFRDQPPWCHPENGRPNAEGDVQMHSQVASPLHLLKGNLPLILLLVLLTTVNVATFLGTFFVCHRKCRTRKEIESEWPSSSPEDGDRPSPIFQRQSANSGPTFQHFFPHGQEDLDFSPPRRQFGFQLAKIHGQDPQQIFTSSSASMPSIQEELYEVIMDDYNGSPLAATFSGAEMLMKTAGGNGIRHPRPRLSSSTRCHSRSNSRNCFPPTQAQRQQQQHDRQSQRRHQIPNASTQFPSHQLGMHNSICSSSSSSSSSTTSFSSSNSMEAGIEPSDSGLDASGNSNSSSNGGGK